MSVLIEKYIPELLYNHECVIIPEFGGFVSRMESSIFDEKTSVFSPPSKSISFNKNLINNDGLLINRVMNAEKISYELASIITKNTVAVWNQQLVEKKRLELIGIGIFCLNADQTIQFEPRVDVNFLIESYGLYPVKGLVLNTEIKDSIIELTPSKTKEKDTLLQQGKKYLKIAAMIALPVIAFGILKSVDHKKLSPVFTSAFNLKSSEASYLAKKYDKKNYEFSGNVSAFLSHSENNNASVNLKNGKTIFFSKTENTTETVEGSTFSATDQYQIIIGCFAVESNAKKLVKSVTKQHKSAFTAGKNKKGLHVVSAGSSNNHETAINLLKAIQEEYPNAWILNKSI
jgi:hypothetical protein